jgi:DNA helicase II / ATP-dependent DNA helicase PcrA
MSSASPASLPAPPEAVRLLAELNPEQAAAAGHGDGPLLIIAGAGTGKTRTLVYRVAHLIARGVRPERILLLTFTRRAAQEMLGRTERLVGPQGSRVHGGTFHATAHRLLRSYGAGAGIPRNFTILDQEDAEALMGISRAALGFAQKQSRFPKKETLHELYSRHVNTDVAVRDLLATELPDFAEREAEILRIFADYTARKESRNLVDYDDLLLFWAGMLEAPGELSARIGGLYDHVLVDEYQDTNALQARVLRLLCRTHRNITVVGDDAQSIYSFRGATIRNILDFPEHFPGCRVVTLERNYRSTQPILDAGNDLIESAGQRFRKRLWTERPGGELPVLVAADDEQEQTRFLVERILELHEEGIPLREMAVLFRAGYMSADLEIELTNRHIPYEKWGGLKFLEAAHVKDVLAFLRAAENPRDEVSWFRLLRLLPGVGDATARGAVDLLTERSWDPLALAGFRPPARARESHERMVALFRELVKRDGDNVAADIASIRALYDPLLRERYDRVEPRLADLDQLEIIASQFPSRGAFLAELTLEPPSSTQDLAGGSDEEDDALVLSTAHSAKGCEWKVVFLIWAVDGWFPSARALRDDQDTEEERRLMYVAMTRARDLLFVTYPVRAYASRYGADYSIDQLSRFIDHRVRGRMRRIAARRPAAPVDEHSGDGGAGRRDGEPIDLRALLRGRFGG